MGKENPRLVALKQDRTYLQDLLDQPGWAVLEGLIREVQRQATSALKKDKEPQALFQAQGVLRAFEEMWTSLEALKNASDEALALMIPQEETNG